jgi:filamentous hemagglutinin family protein
MRINPTNKARASQPLFSALSLRRKLLPLLIPACLGAAGIGAALANPAGPQVVHGQATFSQQGNVLSITNSPNAIINWSSFSIAPGEMTRFIQQSSDSAVLNRITGQDPSRIMGALQSNGRVYLINPNGILFGANAQVDVNGLVASSLAISNTDFLAGKNKFTAGAAAGDVSNLGAITTPAGGQVLLIAPNVSNSGIITSPQGEVMLAAGRSVQMADAANPDVHVLVSAPTDQAINLGQIVAQSGRIGIYGALINQRGTLNADSAVVGDNGKIVLKASRTTLLEAGSVTTASGAGIGGSGGEIQVLGEQVGLTGNARVDASGQNGGGTILIGGGYQGRNAAVMNAQQVYVGKDAQIWANAIVRGNGGKVIVWGNLAARVFGAIAARGGSESGNGGFVETSGHFLDVAGIHVDAGAANGQKGKWLLDPYDIHVRPEDYMTPLSDVATFDAPSQDGDASYIGAGQISAANADVTLQATHNIYITGAINIDAAGVGLTAQAGNDINVSAPIITNGGALVLSANDNGGGTASGVGKVNLASGTTLTTNGGSLTVRDSTTQPSLATCIVNPTAQGCSAVLPSLSTCALNPNTPGCEAVLPRPDFCGTHPTDPRCIVFMPPTNDQKYKPVERVTQTTVSLIDRLTGSPTGTPADSSKPQDTRKVPGPSENSGAKNEKPATKLYCN